MGPTVSVTEVELVGVVVGVGTAAFGAGVAGHAAGGVVHVGHQRQRPGGVADVIDRRHPVGVVVAVGGVDRVGGQAGPFLAVHRVQPAAGVVIERDLRPVGGDGAGGDFERHTIQAERIVIGIVDLPALIVLDGVSADRCRCSRR